MGNRRQCNTKKQLDLGYFSQVPLDGTGAAPQITQKCGQAKELCPLFKPTVSLSSTRGPQKKAINMN